jgi:hypothetical protein
MKRVLFIIGISLTVIFLCLFLAMRIWCGYGVKGLFKDDPQGKTCKYHHDRVLCQYEIHKAIVSIEHKWLGPKGKNWFGSWSRLNK